MPVYAEGFRHQRNCPHFVVEQGLLGEVVPPEDLSDRDDTASTSSPESGFQGSDKRKEAQKLCKDRRCCTWFDLANWFGYLPLELPPADFEACFTDVAHGGTG